MFNIDVKKSQLHPSEEAEQALNDISDKFKKKSKKAWNNAKAERDRKLNSDAFSRSNEIAGEVELPDELPRSSLLPWTTRSTRSDRNKLRRSRRNEPNELPGRILPMILFWPVKSRENKTT